MKLFVPMLEKLGCITEWSCEGLPGGFHVTFHGPEIVARAIASLGLSTSG